MLVVYILGAAVIAFILYKVLNNKSNKNSSGNSYGGGSNTDDPKEPGRGNKFKD